MSETITSFDYASRFDAGMPFAEFVTRARENADLWASQWRRAAIPQSVRDRVAAIPGSWRLLVLLEDWCGDAVNTIPVLARLAEDSPNLSLRVIGRDEHPDVMDRHLTNGSRSIPMVLLLDETGGLCGAWGPRPAVLQSWVLGEGRALEKAARYKQVRTWYVRDRGATTLEEIAELLESASAVAT